ncbi:hypothetical protein CROQUDRAFT_133389 [Cronartium quercuum f. sp. fusiforme G11]|uniref:Uncharacterized protein n=1 Tax=Cronartium quercuum f. sp. fusiforme G11 TaxID=708437 RepID=A0A9P6NL38_9BASI|nr:hypothetical protein CROQUDRAFT_133389 [Cronartium quercuum f. sp. fusiforme G11]
MNLLCFSLLFIIPQGLFLIAEEHWLNKLERRHAPLTIRSDGGNSSAQQSLKPPAYCRTDKTSWAALEVRQAAANIRSRRVPGVQCHSAVAVLKHKDKPSPPEQGMSSEFLRQLVTQTLADHCGVNFTGTEAPHLTYPGNHQDSDNKFIKDKTWLVRLSFGAVVLPEIAKECKTLDKNFLN